MSGRETCTWCGGFRAPLWLVKKALKADLNTSLHDCYQPLSKKQYLHRVRKALKLTTKD